MVRFGKLTSVAGATMATALVMACSQLAGIGSTEANDLPAGSTSTKPTGSDGKADDRNDANISITAGEMKFGDLACGKESVASLVTIHNAGPTSTTYKVVIPDGTAFRIEGALEGPLAARNGLVTLKVFAKPASAADSATDIVISAGDAVQTIHPTVHGSGATVELMPTVVPFGDVRMQSGGGPIDVTIANNGTAPAVISGFDANADFAVDLGAPQLTIAPRSTAVVKAMLKPGSESTMLLHADLKPVLAQVLCGAAPVLTLEGKRVNSSVTLSSGDFGKVNCAPQNNSKDIVISNYSTTMLSYTATLDAASAFTIVSGAAGTIAPGTTAKPTTAAVKVQPKPFGTNLAAINEELSINIGNLAAPDGGLRKVPLKVEPRGAIVTFTPQSILTFSSDGVTTDRKTFIAKNTGNDRVYIVWDFQRTVGGTAWIYDPPSSLDPGEMKTGTVDFKPTTQGDNQAKLIPYRGVNWLGQGAVICNPPLNPILLEGTKP